VLGAGTAAGLVGLAGCSGDEPSSAPSATPTATSSATPSASATPTSTASATASPTASTAPDPRVAAEIVTGLAVPWGLVFLDASTALVGERDTGRLLRVTDGDPGSAEPVATLDVRSRVDEGGETGLLGLALHPRFASNQLLYAYLSTDDDNRVVRMTYDGTRLGTPRPVLTGIATSTHHNGGGLAFGPDGLLYVSTGDAEDQGTPQDTGSLNGKVLRMTDAGKVPDGNPFDNLVWSYGHRNVEGLVFDDQGRLWASEFGDKGADELNLIAAGQDYGWPDVEGDSSNPDYTNPLATWPVADCSPSGIAVTAGRAWLGALQGECLWSVVLDGANAGRERRHLSGYGRLRGVHLAPDGSLWVTTSNRDGRVDPRAGDDRILRVVL
jgi:glucose/arabinose dehydrogenase